jgi:hypothetical protein
MISRETSRVLRRLGGRVARLTGGDAAFDWQAWYRRALRKGSTADLFARHGCNPPLQDPQNRLAAPARLHVPLARSSICARRGLAL